MEIRSLNPSDEAAVLELVSRVLTTSSIPRTPEFWRWKHVDGPFGPSPGLIAEEDGQIIGLRMFLSWQWQSGPKIHRAVRAVDTITAPEARGRGVFTQLTLGLVDQMRKEGVSFVFNTPNEQSRPGYLKMGWQDVTRVPVLIRLMKPLSIVRRRFSGSAEPGKSGAVHHSPGAESIAELCGSPDLAAFLPAVGDSERRLCTPRSPEYLDWRYGTIPGFEYRARSRFENESGAVVIYRHRSRGRLSELSFSEVLVSPDPEGARSGAKLLRDVIKGSPADYAAACAARGTWERSALLRAGFLPVGLPGPRFTVYPLQESLSPDPLAWSSWRTSVGDLELF